MLMRLATIRFPLTYPCFFSGVYCSHLESDRGKTPPQVSIPLATIWFYSHSQTHLKDKDIRDAIHNYYILSSSISVINKFLRRMKLKLCKMLTTFVRILLVLVFGSLGLSTQTAWVDSPPKYDCPKRSIFPCDCMKGSDEGGLLGMFKHQYCLICPCGLQQVKTLIHTLIISNCNIEKLYGSLFKLLTIRILKIHDTPIKDISDGTFDQLSSSLEELHIQNSLLTCAYLPLYQKNLTSLKILFIENSQISYLPEGVLNGMNSLEELSISHGKIQSIGNKVFNDEEELFRAVSRIGTVDLARNNLTKVDYQLFSDLRFIDTISLSYYLSRESNKKTLTKKHFQILLLTFRKTQFNENTYATEFLLQYNKLTSMSGVPLASQKGLKFLNVSHNAIVDIPRNTFPKLIRNIPPPRLSLITTYPSLGLSSIRFVKLHHNPITGNSISSYLFEHHGLFLYNNIKEIKGRQPWPVMNSLLELTLDYNQVGKFYQAGRFDGAFKGMSALYDINISSFRPEERLVCADSLDALKFKLNPDIKFRQVKRIEDSSSLSWYVNTNEDVGDFRLEIRSSDFPPQTLAREERLDYGSRYTIIKK
ncbi:unnamed protein product [Lepeophtheirus salmonis]|uniref:(salmon louse) hypothetical protein n=1 Tax=Lepeophtheirus salmonis TaxID=72036 RepID=A0A7R8CBN6_LEPSM|nr:unnamed protein product [Lepeophtheirus salmonis]CAF2760995.1 unnamed protein product [Lepeophtheirus salmonis]